MLLDDYSGPFEPDLDLGRFTRRALAVLGREWMLHGHLQDRVAMPLVLSGRSREEMERIAIAEWMGASPVYSRRMQRAMGFGGDDVGTIMKNLQLDIGAPHHYMDFRFRLDDADHGEFWLAYCGALMDVEPMGAEFVHGMCHTIEDPTFDATAAATNPRAQIRPLHRPPRVPAGREPHCHWTITIDHAATPVWPHPNVAEVEAARIASVEVDRPEADAEPGGWADYRGEFDPDFQLEDLSHRALVVALQEFAVQSHVLFRSLLLAVSQRYGHEEATALAPPVFRGLAGLTAQRLRTAMGIGTDAAALAKLLQIHPTFWPRTYVDPTVEALDDQRVRFAVRPCPALAEGDGYTWFAQLGGPADGALDAIAWAIDPRAAFHPVATNPGENLAWEAVIDPSVDPLPEPGEIGLAKISTGAHVVFTPRRPVRA